MSQKENLVKFFKNASNLKTDQWLKVKNALKQNGLELTKENINNDKKINKLIDEKYPSDKELKAFISKIEINPELNTLYQQNVQDQVEEEKEPTNRDIMKASEKVLEELKKLKVSKEEYGDKKIHDQATLDLVKNMPGMKEAMQKGLKNNHNLLMSDVMAQRTLKKEFAKLQADDPLTEEELFRVYNRVQELKDSKDPKKNFIGRMTEAQITRKAKSEYGDQHENNYLDNPHTQFVPDLQSEGTTLNGKMPNVQSSIQGGFTQSATTPTQVYNVNTGNQIVKTPYSYLQHQTQIMNKLEARNIVREKEELHSKIFDILANSNLSYRKKAEIEQILEDQMKNAKNLAQLKDLEDGLQKDISRLVHVKNEKIKEEEKLKHVQMAIDQIFKNMKMPSQPLTKGPEEKINAQFGEENAPMTNAKNGKPVEYPNLAEPKQIQQQKAVIAGQQRQQIIDSAINPRRARAEVGQQNRPNPPGQGQVVPVVFQQYPVVETVLEMQELWDAIQDSQNYNNQTDAQRQLMNNKFIDYVNGDIDQFVGDFGFLGSEFGGVQLNPQRENLQQSAYKVRSEIAKQKHENTGRRFAEVERQQIEQHTKQIEDKLKSSVAYLPLGSSELKMLPVSAQNSLPGAQIDALKKDTLGQAKYKEVRESIPGTGAFTVRQIVEMVYEMSDYVAKISGDIDPQNKNLKSYKTKTEIFNPVIVKKEPTDFKITAQSAFKSRKC